MENSKISDVPNNQKEHCEIPPHAATSQVVTENLDPHCGHEEGISSWGAAILIIKGCLGCLFLLMPYIIKKLGYITGSITVIFAGIIYYHIIHTLLSTEHQLCQELNVQQLSYVEVAEKTFLRSPFPLNRLHSAVRYLIYFFYGLPTSNASVLILTSNGIQSLMKRFNLNIKTTHIISVEIIPLTLICLVPNILEILVPYSSVTNILTLFMATATIASSVIYRKQSVPLQPFGDIYSFPECVARCVKAYCCTGMILPIKNNMRNPRQMVAPLGSLNVAAAIVILFYYSFGITLYANYGEEVQANVLLNLPAENYLSDCVNFLYTSSLFVTYILIFFCRFNNVWSGSFKAAFAGNKYEFWMEYGIRLGINMLAYLLAVGIPNFAIISALAGTASFIVEVALPSILELLTAMACSKKNRWVVAKDLMIIGVCFVLFFMSLYSCIKHIVLLYI